MRSVSVAGGTRFQNTQMLRETTGLRHTDIRFIATSRYGAVIWTKTIRTVPRTSPGLEG